MSIRQDQLVFVIMRREQCLGGERGLDLGRKYIHAADNQYVVAAAFDALDPAHGAPAARASANQACEVARAVADDGIASWVSDVKTSSPSSPSGNTLPLAGSMISWKK
jgi:hypothetical protein